MSKADLIQEISAKVVRGFPNRGFDPEGRDIWGILYEELETIVQKNPEIAGQHETLSRIIAARSKFAYLRIISDHPFSGGGSWL